MRDEVKQVSNKAQAAATSAQPYRRHIVGLPLQRSLFVQAARGATTIGLPGLSSELDFPAWLDENGDLFLDRSQVAALSKAASAAAPDAAGRDCAPTGRTKRGRRFPRR